MDPKTLTFAFEKTTKNTVKYEEQPVGGQPIVGSLYVQKWAAGDPPPQTLTMTLTAK